MLEQIKGKSNSANSVFRHNLLSIAQWDLNESKYVVKSLRLHDKFHKRAEMRIANLESNSALERIAASSNTEVPAFLSILKLNYSVIACDDGLLRCKSKDSSTEYIAESMIEILGLISMHKYRGKDWRAKDEEVESYLKQFSTKE